VVSMLDDVRGYLQLATGLTEVTANKAKEVAMSLVGQGFTLSTKAPDVVGQVQELADDLVSTSKNNREMLVSMIRSEVDRAVGRMGFVREDELAALRRHVQRLEQQLDELRGQSRPAGGGENPEQHEKAGSGATADPAPKQAAGAKTAAEPKPEGEDAPAPVLRKKKKVVVEPGGSTADAG
jgi:polyhydroxyalkanoate synthesis regulator phasin